MTESDIGTFIFHGDEERVAEKWMWFTLCNMKLSSRIKFCWMVLKCKPPEWIK